MLAPALRISIFLPVGKDTEQQAANQVVDYMYESFEGATYSNFQPAAYQGYWLDENGKLWIDEISIAFVDLRQNLDRRAIDDLTVKLQQRAAEIYDGFNAHQELFWITVEGLEVFRDE
jgi:hypothetical protein